VRRVVGPRVLHDHLCVGAIRAARRGQRQHLVGALLEVKGRVVLVQHHVLVRDHRRRRQRRLANPQPVVLVPHLHTAVRFPVAQLGQVAHDNNALAPLGLVSHAELDVHADGRLVHPLALALALAVPHRLITQHLLLAVSLLTVGQHVAVLRDHRPRQAAPLVVQRAAEDEHIAVRRVVGPRVLHDHLCVGAIRAARRGQRQHLVGALLEVKGRVVLVQHHVLVRDHRRRRQRRLANPQPVVLVPHLHTAVRFPVAQLGQVAHDNNALAPLGLVSHAELDVHADGRLVHRRGDVAPLGGHHHAARVHGCLRDRSQPRDVLARGAHVLGQVPRVAREVVHHVAVALRGLDGADGQRLSLLLHHAHRRARRLRGLLRRLGAHRLLRRALLCRLGAPLHPQQRLLHLLHHALLRVHHLGAVHGRGGRGRGGALRGREGFLELGQRHLRGLALRALARDLLSKRVGLGSGRAELLLQLCHVDAPMRPQCAVRRAVALRRAATGRSAKPPRRAAPRHPGRSCCRHLGE